MIDQILQMMREMRLPAMAEKFEALSNDTGFSKMSI